MTELSPMPADFDPPITRETVRGSTVWTWRETLMVDGLPVSLEYGLRHEDPAMRQKIWEIHEHARLGNHGHLSHVRSDRHSRSARLATPATVQAPANP